MRPLKDLNDLTPFREFEAAVRVGDTTRISVELVNQMKTETDGYSLLVRVCRIERNEHDGTFMLWLENVA